MSDELLTVLLQIKGDTRDLKAQLAGLEGATTKVTKATKEATKAQDSWFDSTRKGLITARARFGEFTGTIGMAKTAFGLLSGAADAFAAKNETAGKKWKEANAAVSEGLDKVQQAIGGIVVSLSPLIGLLGKVAGAVGDVAIGVSELLTGGGNNREGVMDNADLWRALLGGTSAGDQASINMRLADARKRMLDNSDDGTYDPDTGLYIKAGGWGAVNLSSEYGPPKKSKPRSGRRSIEVDDYTGPRIGDSPIGRMGHDFWGDELGRNTMGIAGAGSFGGGLGANVSSIYGPSIDQLTAAQERNTEAAAAFKTDQAATYLETIFGPLDQFDLYAQGFDLLTGAAQSSFDAWVSGSATASESAKKFFGDLIGGAASFMWGESIKHGVMALASLIPGPLFNPASAAGNAKVAAAYGAGALLVGGAARKYGGAVAGGAGGGGSGGSSGGYGANLGGGGGGGGAEGSHTTIYMGDYFADNNPQAQKGRISRALRTANKDNGTSSVSWS